MRRTGFTAAAAGVLAAMSCVGDRSVPVHPDYPQTRVFDRSCSSLWPELLNVIDRTGFRLMQHDRSGWIASFRWGTSQLPVNHAADLDFDRLAINEDGSWRKSSELRVESAVLVLTPRKPGCEAAVRVTYQGEPGGFWRSRQANPISSGLLESLILSKSGSAIARKNPRGRRAS
jgi:hypothetical protein